MTLTFVVPGPPVGKQRARTFRHKQSGRIISMTPAKTVNYEALIKQTFAAKYPGHVPYEGPVFLTLYVNVMPSKDATRRLKNNPAFRPTIKPDVDNVLKIYADAMNGLAYVDDKQIVSAKILKFYGNPPRVEVEVNGEYLQTTSRGEAA